MTIGLPHFLVVSLLLVAAGIATMLTKRSAIGILIGVELVLNAAAINFVAFNRYAWPGQPGEAAVVQPAAAAQPPKAGTEIVALDIPDPSGKPAAGESRLVSDAGGQRAYARGFRPAVDGQMFAVFVIVLAAAEAAVALAIFLNFYNNFSSIDVEKGDELRG